MSIEDGTVTLLGGAVPAKVIKADVETAGGAVVHVIDAGKQGFLRWQPRRRAALHGVDARCCVKVQTEQRVGALAPV